jgi:hypothetical protein
MICKSLCSDVSKTKANIFVKGSVDRLLVDNVRFEIYSVIYGITTRKTNLGKIFSGYFKEESSFERLEVTSRVLEEL